MEISIKVTLPTGAGRLFAPGSSEVSAALGEVFRRRGYIVIGTVPGARYEIGTKLRSLWGYTTRRTFVVAEFTTWDDCEEQQQMLAKLKPEWKRRPGALSRRGTFYRVVPLTSRDMKKLKQPKSLKGGTNGS